MKKIILFSAFAVSLYTCALSQGNSVSSPSTINQFYYLSAGNQLMEIEKTEVIMQTKTKMAGFGGVSTSYYMEGTGSNTRIDNLQPSFSIRIDNMLSQMMTDYENMFRLYRFEKKGEKREAVLTKSGFMGKGSSQNLEGIKCNYSKNDKQAIILTPKKPLEPGEYAIVLMILPGSYSDPSGKTQSYTAFAFTLAK